MELLFESRVELALTEGKVYAQQEKPEVLAEPVFVPEGPADGNRVQVSRVLKDGGVYRMWYMAFPNHPDVERSGRRSDYFYAYAESDDGFTWHRPDLGIVSGVPFGNNYINMAASGFIDPDAPPSHRYRGVAYLRYLRQTWAGSDEDARGTGSSFYTVHSADGLHWETDSPEPRWFSGDTCTSAYHTGRGCGLAAIKFVRRVNNIHRRGIWVAEYHDGEWGDPACALMPDPYDDMAAAVRGFVSTDHYNMGMMAAGQGVVGFLNNFRHLPPLSMKPDNYAVYGSSDISLVFQAHAGDRWLHAPARQSFITSGEHAWHNGWTGPSSEPVEIGDHQCLYFTGHPHDHAWDRDLDWQVVDKWEAVREASAAHSVIGLARWPKWRLFGMRADPEGRIEVEVGRIDDPCELILNYRAGASGSVRVQVYDRKGRGDHHDIEGRSSPDHAIPLTGDSLGEVVRWRNGSILTPQDGRTLVARLTLENATVYAWELRPPR